MKRRLNAFIWVGFLTVLLAFASYLPLFARFPSTRDLPWVNLLLFAVGGVLTAAGIGRAFRQPEAFRGKVLGPVLGAVGALLCGFFLVGVFHQARQLPASKGAPRVGQAAPEFTLRDKGGHPVALSALLAPSGGARSNVALLIFYRGAW